MGVYMKSAGKGKAFVLTEKGYDATPRPVKTEREVGKPIKGFETNVPRSWLEKEYVREVQWTD